uniref:Riboflavin transporter n=1 Tax=Hucho hucho TaxID=62062 RepID=A0A4W5KYP5_9TELE
LPLQYPDSLFTHILDCLFGMGSWVSNNGLWVELPVIVPQIPEGWYLPSYLSVLIQMANVVPLFVPLIFLLAFFWKETLVMAGVPCSMALVLLTFFLSIVDCTSSVNFLPFMMRLKPQYLTTYFVGEGVSGMLPSLVVMIQGVGVVHCNNSTRMINDWLSQSKVFFFFFLSAMMLVCLGAFVLLNYHPTVAQECPNVHYPNGVLEKGDAAQKNPTEPKPLIKHSDIKPKRSFGTRTYRWIQVLYIFFILAWVNGQTNIVLPSVQSYSCLRYGNSPYILSAIMAAVSNPPACFIAMFFPIFPIGSVVGAYIMGMAVLSPLHFILVSNLRWAPGCGVILRDEGHSAVVWWGAVVQLGSLMGAVTMFPLVSVYSLFLSGDPCNTRCP